jgi:hypothetical protein
MRNAMNVSDADVTMRANHGKFKPPDVEMWSIIVIAKFFVRSAAMIPNFGESFQTTRIAVRGKL